MKKSTCSFLPAFLAVATALHLVANSAAAGARPSVWVYPSYTGDLLYAADTNGLRINDFSECGYKRGLTALPNVSNLVEESRWIFMRPFGSGRDDGEAINQALFLAGSRPPNSNGFRGVVYLGPGQYLVSETNALRLTNSGVVLKGAGASAAGGTRVDAMSSGPYSLIHVTGTGDRTDVPGVAANFTEKLVPAGTRTFRVDTTNGFHVGDSVVITHPSTYYWILANDMDELGEPWTPGSYDGIFERVLTRLETNWMTVDTPIPQTFQAIHGGGTVGVFTWPERIQNCGVEDLYCYTSYAHEEPEGGNPAVEISKTTDAWVRRVIADGFFSHAVRVGDFSKFVTVAECQNWTAMNADFHFRYSFYLDKTYPEYVLMRDCYSFHSRHSFVLGARVPGPNAFVRCDANFSDDETGPHERWSTGALFDNVRQYDNEFGVWNRGNSGGGHSYHGWTSAFTAVWNCYAEDGFRVRSPPTARNWLIGSDGEKMESKRGCWYSFIPLWPDGDCWAVGADPPGTYDQSGEGAQPVQLRSLYYAQLQQRLKWPSSQYREYRIGDMDGLRLDFEDLIIPLDSNWLSQVQAIAGDTRITSNFEYDIVHQTQWVAFTFTFPIYPGEQMVDASLTLGLRFLGRPPATSGTEILYLETVDVAHLFSDYGWNVATNGSSAHTVRIAPGDLSDGKFNIAIGPHCAVDFAMLNLQVAPNLAYSTQSLNPIDTYVRDGSFANQNFAGDPELVIKDDNDAGFSRRAFLDWNLIEVSGPLADAKVHLYCNSTGQAGNEQSASEVTARNWSPNSVTWNTQPPASPPLAYWVPEGTGFFAEFTVTPEVTAALAGDHRFALCIKSAQDFGAGGNVSYASSDDPNPAHRPQLILRFTNSAPSIVVPGKKIMSANSTIGPFAVTIGDPETSAGSLVLTASSSVPSVIANSDITLGGSGANRTVSIHVPAGRIGTSVITLTVSDGAQTASGSFIVNVNYVNTAPTISPIQSQVTDEDTPLTVQFTIGDSNNLPNHLSVGVSTSNDQLFPAGSIQPPATSFGTGTGSRALVFTPAPNRSGTATVTVSVSDGFLTATQTFTLTVGPVEDPPTLVRITSPRTGDHLLPGVPALITAEAFDAETNLARLQFYGRTPSSRIDQLIGLATNAPYSATWSNPPAGDFALYATAFDRTGLGATSPPVAISVSAPMVSQPKLYIARLTNSVAVLWLDSVSSNALQTATNLVEPAPWSPASSPPQLGEGAWIYLVPPSDKSRFFRLAQ